MSRNIETFNNNHSLYELVVARLIAGIPCDGVYIDCGAHGGLHTKVMLDKEGVSKVYAIEAIPSLCDALNNKFGDNSKYKHPDQRFRLIRSAVGNYNGETTFNIAKNLMGYSGIRQRDIVHITEWEEIQVPMCTLDSVMKDDIDNICCIKLDLEGGEFDALKGATQVLHNSRPLLIFENALQGTGNLYGYDANEFFDFFYSHEYKIFDFFCGSVDSDYWYDVLRTYMFTAVPIGSELERWLIPFLRKTVDEVVVSI